MRPDTLDVLCRLSERSERLAPKVAGQDADVVLQIG